MFTQAELFSPIMLCISYVFQLLSICFPYKTCVNHRNSIYRSFMFGSTVPNTGPGSVKSELASRQVKKEKNMHFEAYFLV